MNPLKTHKLSLLALGFGAIALFGGLNSAHADSGKTCRTYHTIEYRWGVPYKVSHKECAKPVVKRSSYPASSWLSFNFFGSPSYVSHRTPARYYTADNRYWHNGRSYDRDHNRDRNHKKKRHDRD